MGNLCSSCRLRPQIDEASSLTFPLLKHPETEFVYPAFSEERKLMICSKQKDGDNDRLFKAIKQVQKKCSNDDEFLMIIAKYPRALNMLASFRLVTEQKLDSVIKLYQHGGDYLKAGSVAAKAACNHTDISTRITALKRAARIYHMGGSSCRFYEEALNNQIKLLVAQQQLEVITGEKCFIGRTVYENIESLITLSSKKNEYFAQSRKFSKQFNVSLTQYWWIMIKTMVFNSQWEDLYAITKKESPPTGYVPVVKALLDGERMDLAKKISDLIRDNDERNEALELFRKVSRSHHADDSDEGD